MKTQPRKTERLHSLDSLRAIMMLLGLVIHSAITYGIVDYGGSWSLKDPIATHLSNDLIVGFIHSFRMQLFFLVAGFFGAMLFYERKPIKMLKNRVSRIVFPFIVFVVLLWPSIVFTFGYTRTLFAGNTNALEDTLAKFSSLEILIPKSTFHLWFLYYLAMITFVSVVVALVFKKLPVLSNTISNAFSWVIQKTVLRILIFGCITAVVYFIMGTSSVDTSNSFIPDYNTFMYYFVFYMIGWVLFKSKHLLETFVSYDWLNIAIGMLLFFTYAIMRDDFSYEAAIVLKSIMVWCLIFGITGLFIRFGSRHSAKMRYISDASYWVYLLHLPLTAFLPSLLVDWDIPATFKFLTVASISTLICFFTYHYFVRSTFIGKFLNGRKYSRKLSEIKALEQPVMPNMTLVNDKKR
jgi:peptidoglycan/LPS O-acetylase OafA/YrhL